VNFIVYDTAKTASLSKLNGDDLIDGNNFYND